MLRIMHVEEIEDLLLYLPELVQHQQNRAPSFGAHQPGTPRTGSGESIRGLSRAPTSCDARRSTRSSACPGAASIRSA